jgi:chromosome segregation ATPase
MNSVIDLYDKLRLAPDDNVRARVIAEAFEALENRYPHLQYLVTTRDLSETELKLTKEIEAVRLQTEAVRSELKETELKLAKEIETVRAELKETELKLTKEIEAVRLQTEAIRSELKETELRLTKEIEAVRSGIIKWSFLFWISQFGAVMLLLWRLWPAH